MTAQNIHRIKIKEHLQELKDALAIGLERRPATIGFHTSACAIDMLELFLHQTGKIPLGKQIKHEWFKRPKPGQKIKPLAERHLPFSFPEKEAIFNLCYSIEESRNTLIYGNAPLPEIKTTWETFLKLKRILVTLLEGEEFEDANP